MTATREPTEPEELLLGILVADILRLMREDFAARTRSMPLTPALHRLLFYVARRPGARQVELAEWLDVTPVTVGRMLDRLERQSLVRREAHPTDRRASCVYIGERATDLLAGLTEKAQQTRERAVQGLTSEQRRELLLALARVRSNFGMPGPVATAAGDAR